MGFNEAVPKVHEHKGFRFYIYPGDHHPPHVHVLKAGGEARIVISKSAPVLTVQGMSKKDSTTAAAVVAQMVEYLLEKWEEYYVE